MFRADAAGCAGSTWGLCYSALARRRAVPLHRIVNCVPARCCVRPDIGRHRRLVRAGVWRRGGELLLRRFAFGSRPPCASIGRFCVRSRLSLFLCQEKRDGLRDVAFLFRGVGIAIRTFSNGVRLSGMFGSLRACAFLYGDPDGVRGNAETRDTGNGVGGAACVRLCVNLLALPCFRGESVGGYAPPNLRQRVFDSLDSLLLIRGKVPFAKHGKNRYPRIIAPTPCSTRVHGKTRPSPSSARAGRAVYRCYLYAPTSRLEPPPSGAESGCVREAVWGAGDHPLP